MPRWSHSRLFKLFHCGEAFRRQYLENERAPGTLPMHRGSAVAEAVRQQHLRQHAVREHLGPGNYSQAELNDALPDVQEVEDIAAQAFDERAREGITYTSDEESEGSTQARGRSKDDAIAMAGMYRDEVAVQVDPVGVERKTVFRPRGLTDAKGEPLEIVTVRDVVADTPFGRVVRDTKTASKSPAAGTADASGQLSVYALAEFAETGQLPHRLTLDYLVVTPTGLGKVVVQETTRDGTQLRAVVERIRAAQAALDAGVFLPANPGGLCSERWCAFWRTCKYVGGRDDD